MKNKMKNTIGKKFLLIGMLAIALAIAGVVVGVGGTEEILQLEQELVDSGYEWLINYSINYPSVEVYVGGGAPPQVPSEEGNEMIALFENVSGEGWYKVYLSNLGENVSEDVFDLRVEGMNVPYGVFQKKMRVDEIRRLVEDG